MDRKVIKNYLYNFGYQILLVLLPLVTTPYVSRVLGAENIGIYGYTHAISQYFVLFGCIGLNLYGQREIAFCQEDLDKRSRIFAELMTIRVGSVFVSLLVFMVSCCLHGKYSRIFMIHIMDIVAAMVDISWFFQGVEDFKKITLRNAVVKLTGAALVFVLVKESSDLPLYVICYSGTLLLGNLSMWLYIRRYIRKIQWKQLKFIRHIKPAIIMFLPQIATSMYTMLDKPMIGLLTGDESQVAYYEQAQKILKVALAVPTSLGTVMLPRISNMFASQSIEKIKNQMYKSFQFIMMITLPLCFGIIAVAEDLVPWFFGEGYDQVVPNMVGSAPIIICIGLSNIIGVQYLLPTKRQREYTISVLCGTVVNLVMNLMMIPRLQSVGATIATVMAEMFVTLSQMFFVRKEFSLKKLIPTLSRYIFATAVMFFAVHMLAQAITPGVVGTFLEVLSGIVVYIGMLTVLRDEMLNDIFKKVAGKDKK